MILAPLIAELNLFVASTQAAAPLTQASALTKGALLIAGNQLIADVEAAKAVAGVQLDAADPTGFPGDMVTALFSLASAADDQSALADIRGSVGRMVFNLAQL
jgi:hypothetical protein